jgi:hypothetical protein
MKDICEDYASGILSWYYFPDCSQLPAGPCRELCQQEKAKATPNLPDLLPTIQKPGESYRPTSLDYITGNFGPTDKSLIMGTGLHDLWGRISTVINGSMQSEDNRYYVESSMERVRQIGSELVMVTDFAVLDDDLSIHYELRPGGAHTMGKNELRQIVDYAKKNGQKVMLMTNLMGEATARANIESPSDATLDKLFTEWGNIIEEQAAQAEYAGIDYFIINPRDVQFNSFEASSHLNELYSGLIDRVAGKYSGKLSVWWDIYPKGIWFADNDVYTFYKKLDCVATDCAVQFVFDGTAESLDSIETAWMKVLAEPGFVKLKDKENFLLILMPAYDGAMQGGWIEPGMTYPEGKYRRDWKEQALVYEGLFRALYDNTAANIGGIISYGYWWTDTLYPQHWVNNDLGHSIRDKDAEHVFYRWSQIFK